MPGPSSGRKVLVVEDEYLIAFDLVAELERAGWQVVGPVSTLAEALKLLFAVPVDYAVLDIQLRDASSIVLADLLASRGVPFVFATGFGDEIIPLRHLHVARWEKPYKISEVVASLRRSSANTCLSAL